MRLRERDFFDGVILGITLSGLGFLVWGQILRALS